MMPELPNEKTVPPPEQAADGTFRENWDRRSSDQPNISLTQIDQDPSTLKIFLAVAAVGLVIGIALYIAAEPVPVVSYTGADATHFEALPRATQNTFQSDSIPRPAQQGGVNKVFKQMIAISQAAIYRTWSKRR